LTGPLLLWLTIQWLALGVALMRVPLAAGYPQPAELLAAHVLVFTQITATALLFPWLMRAAASAIVTIATTWPLLVVAGIVAGVPVARLMDVGCYVTAWMLALWAWTVWAPRRWNGVAVAVASIVTAGSLVLFYLGVEFTSDGREDIGVMAWLSPPLAAMKRIDAPQSARDYGIIAVVVAGAAGCRFIAPRYRQVIHNR